MDAIKLGVLPAMSHSWHRHADSWFLVRAIKTLVNGIKALFGRYTVSVLDDVTPRLVLENPDSSYAKVLRKPLSAYQIDIVKTFSDKGKYLADKIKQLCNKGRTVEVKLAFKPEGVEAVPMYFSKNEKSECLNCEVHRPLFDKVEGGELIQCRHLALGYVTGVFGRGKHTFSSVDTRSALKSFSDKIPTDEDLEARWWKPSSEGYYFTKSTLSHAIQSIARKYWDMPNTTEKSFLFMIPGHVMALRFKKQEGCLKVIFYEPNDTGRHKTFSLYDPDNVCALEPKDILSVWHPDNLDKLNSGIIISYDTRENLGQCHVNVFGDVDFQLIEKITFLARHSDHPKIKSLLKVEPEGNRGQE
ncbi:hypothetical protein [Endozoicomonas acroporae]|uniref:hypothetical protein n=1 Tax=Endozoicomonas acroporae TaxID=1701104 RepID=UPI003D791FF2